MKDNKEMMILGGVALAVVCTLLTSCGQADTESTMGSEPQEMTETVVEPAWRKYADDPVTLEWYVNYTWFTGEWGKNLVSKTITEETGVSIEFITPSGNESEKLASLISSDSLPDFITLGWWESQIDDMIDKDMVYALNELADEYDAYFWEVSNEERVNWYTQPDGNIYGYPNSSVTPKDVEEHPEIGSNQTFLVRKDIYEAIGSPDMTTPEGFKKAVEKAYEMFPEVDGEPLIPVGAHAFTEQGNLSFDSFLMNFLAVPYEKNGELYDRYTDPEYIIWLKMFRELGQEGMLADDIFIDQRVQMEEKIANGRYFCMLYQYSDLVTQQKEIYANHPERIYMAVDGPRNSAGDDHTLTTTGINGWTVTLISKNCAHPERAIAFLDYLLSEEGQLRTYLGVEGETYDMVDGKPVVKEKVKELLASDRQEYDRLYGADYMYWMLQDNVMQLQWRQEEPEPLAQLREWTYPYLIYNGQYDAFLEPGSEEDYANTRIERLWSETLPKLLLAESEENFDELYAAFLNKRQEYGFQMVQKEKNELMNQAKEQLGIQ